MSLFICSLNSGSNANCYYVGNNREAVLVDAGLSLRETEKRMKLSGLEMDKVKAIFISHEHIDHITGLPALSKKYQLPVYITAGTLQNSNVPVEPHLVQSFSKNKPVTIGALSVVPFSKHHDAADPHSFIVKGNGVTIGVITDIGFACKQVIRYFSQCDAAFLESNYCPDMLASGNYPYHLKRISGDDGHLGNQQALELFRYYKSPSLQLLILSHLSKNNNRPELVEQLFLPHAGETAIHIASRFEAGEVFEVKPGVNSILRSAQSNKNITKTKKSAQHEFQLKLF